MPRAAASVAFCCLTWTLAAPIIGAQAVTDTVDCRQPLEPIPGSFIKGTLTLALDPGYGIRPVDSTSALTALSIVNDELVLPTPLELPPVIAQSWPSPPATADSPAQGFQGFMGEAFVEVTRDGKLKRVGLTQTTLVPSIDVALVAAVTKAAEEGAFFVYQEAAHGSGGYLFVELRTIPLPEFEQKPSDFTHHQAPAGLGAPYATEPRVAVKGAPLALPIRYLRIPIVRLTSVLGLPKKRPAPVFPRDELNAGQEGFVNIEFVVGPDSVIIPGTLRVANGMTAGFAKAVVKAVAGYRFEPATVNRCPIAARETWTFTFGVR